MDRPTEDEFDIIAHYFRPLSGGEKGALNLLDDAALIEVPAGHHPVVTCDALVAGIHFLENTAPADIAHKAVMANLSDLAAMGAIPKWAFLALQLPRQPDGTPDSAWLAAFAGGLGAAMGQYGVKLMGGDTVSTPGPLSVTLTLMGVVPKGWLMKRSGAKAGDTVWVSATLGGAALGLRALRGEPVPGSDAERALAKAAYLRPEARVQLGRRLRDTGLATACIDISDGLVADLGHLCRASGVGARLHADKVPLAVGTDDAAATALTAALTGGDDYELLFTVPAAATDDLLHLSSSEFDFPLSAIGEIVGEPAGVWVTDGQGKRITLASEGWRHF